MYHSLLYDGRMHMKLSFDLLNTEIEYAQRKCERSLVITEDTAKEEISKFIYETKHLNQVLEVVSYDTSLIKELAQECLARNMQIHFIDEKEFIEFENVYTDEQIRNMLEDERMKHRLSGLEFCQRYQINYLTYRSLTKYQKGASALHTKTACQVASICKIHPAQIKDGIVRRKLLAQNPALGGEQ